MGIRSLDLFNRALLGKWAWRYAMEENLVWKSCITAKYGTKDGGWFTPLPRGNYGVVSRKLLLKNLVS